MKKHKRLLGLCDQLGLDAGSIGHLRYQLLHRTVATLIEAKRFHANLAVLAVQSFCPNSTGFEDFSTFCDAIGLPLLERGALVGPKQFGGIDLWVGWQNDEICKEAFESTGNPDFPERHQPPGQERDFT